MPNNLFYRLNLKSYGWEKLNIPALLEKTHLFGSTFGNHFVLFKDSASTFEYSFLSNKWYEDNYKSPNV